MLAAIRSAVVVGVDAFEVTVEVDVTKGLPQWTIVGMAASAVKEARERVASALKNSGFELPSRRFTINLAPGDQPKTGTALDLPIAFGVLAATGQVDGALLDGIVALGELGLDGALRPVRGVLPVAMHLARAGERSASYLVIPPANVGEARLVSRQRSVAPPTLGHAVEWITSGDLRRDELARTWESLALDVAGPATEGDASSVDLSDVVGQESAKRALEIAAAGGHALLMVGPPGGGKTMLARRLATILPPLVEEEALEVLAVQSVAGLLPHARVRDVERPFRAPHHTLSSAALIGGGSFPRAGEVSLAHHGVLFLDELQEMPRSVLDALRQPMEDGRVVIARAMHTVAFPARFALVGAMNPCPCGHAGTDPRRCSCTPADVVRHRARVSGPLADRIDMTIQVPSLPIAALQSATPGESSAAVRARVVVARERQAARYRRLSRVNCNAHALGRWLDSHGRVTDEARALLALSAERLALSARGYHRVLKVARTIADLDGDDLVQRDHVAEALFFRTADSLPSAEVHG